jgi:hypothetical protein
MADLSKRIRASIARVARAALVRDIKGAWWMLAALSLLLALGTYYSASPRHVIAHRHGVIVGAHEPQSEEGDAELELNVLLDTGQTVSVALWPPRPYRARARVEVAVIRRDWPPHSLTYRFLGYVESDDSVR